MARYSLAASLIALLVSNAQGHDDGTDAWSYLPVTVPTPLSDMSIVSLTLGGGNNSTEGEDGDEVKTRIIITGGCDSPMGNEYMEFGEDKFFDCVSLSAKAYAFDPIRNNKFQAWTGTFETLADMPRKRARHASAVVNGNVCLYGGRNETGSLIAEVDCYNPTSNEWSTPTSLPAERQSSDFTAFSTKDHLVYLIGGYTQDYEALDLVTVVDMSDPDNISYSDGPNLRAKRGDIDVAVVNGDVYVSGGFTHENDYATPLNSVEKFNAETQTWSNVDSLNEERGDKQLVALNGKVYAIGGESKVDVTGFEEDELPDLGARSELLDTVEVLDPTEDVHGGMAQWKSLAGMPGQLFRFAASEWEVDEGFIFVFGGQVAYDSDCKCFRTTDKVMVFDVSHAEYEVVASSSDSGAGTIMVFGGSAMVHMFSFAVAGLLWLTL